MSSIVLAPDKELFDSLYERRDKCVKKLRGLNDCIHVLQEDCDHEWRAVATGPKWNYEECTICRKQREI